jgi:uncharacterized pyridoxamine 5'-phosphate oxidase family protein
MKKEEVLAFINANPVCYLATVDDGRPRVRGMLLYRADSEGIIFHTGETKDLFRQILKDPHAEVCFTSPDGSLQVRVSGTAEVVEDMGLKREIVGSREFLQPIVAQTGYDGLKIIRITGCTATHWTFERNFLPKEYIDLT